MMSHTRAVEQTSACPAILWIGEFRDQHDSEKPSESEREDANGAQEYTTYYSEATDDLSSGTLAAGGTKSGTVYFVEGTVKILYFGSMLSDSPSASWDVA